MVLFLAALYYYNQHCQQQQEQEDEGVVKQPTTAHSPSSVRTASTSASSSSEEKEAWSQQLQHLGSSLVETTVGRCTSPNMAPSPQRTTTSTTTTTLSTTMRTQSEAVSGITSQVTPTRAVSGFTSQSAWTEDGDMTSSRYTHEESRDYTQDYSTVDNDDDDDAISDAFTDLDRTPQGVPAHVRDAWIDAVFGETFPENTTTAPSGLVPGFAAYSAAEVQLQPLSNEKLGLTLSRLPLGIHVRQVDPQSEAAVVGVEPDSVLVSINGIPLLAEPSKQALERLWQYQGCLAQTGDEAVDEEGDPTMRHPVALRFWKTGRGDYSVLLFCPPPFGIVWGPCGNFALVKRSYGAAAQAGVPRGALVAAVQGESFRSMDHTKTAAQLRALQGANEPIRILLAVPPSDMRSGHYEQQNNNNQTDPLPAAPKSPQARRTIRTDDGVEVKFHALEFSLFSNLVCQTAVGACMDPRDPRRSLTELAERVAAGRWEEPSKNAVYRAHRIVSPCPKLPNLLDYWNPLESLLYCLQMHQAYYQLDRYTIPRGDPLPMIRAVVDAPFATEMTMTFLLQFLSVICIPSPSSGSNSNTEEEKKTDDKDASQKQAKELTSLLLKLSRRDEGYCQRLYFLLRSFISSLETRRPAAGSKNLLALMNCLELLRFAEKELSTGPNLLPEVPTPSPEASPASFNKDDDKKRSLPFLRKKKPSKAKARPNALTAAVKIPETSSPGGTPRSVVPSYSSTERPREHVLSQSPSVMYEHMSDFLTQLDSICGTVERSLQKSFRQKIADWAMQPWSASKDTALANVTKVMRDSLAEVADNMLLVNPVESSELLSAVDTEECYILPSAHFPILLTFDVSERRASDSPAGEERIYRTTVEFVQLQHVNKFQSNSYIVHAAVGGKINNTDPSRCIDQATTKHSWFAGNKLVFDSRSSWGAPQTLSLRVSPQSEGVVTTEEVSFGWMDLQPCWSTVEDTEKTYTVRQTVDLRDPHEQKFDESGFLPDDYKATVTLEVKVTTECVDFDQVDGFSRKRMLLYKHDDDLRQEAFAVQFIRTCDRILRATGLDMKLLTFQCVPVGTRRGFVEWVPGSVPLSEVCQPFLGSILETTGGLTKYESLRRLGGQQSESFQRLAGGQTGKRGTFANNPVADYLRSVAYDPEAPYLIRRDVMDTYVKSCAGYSVITYILGVGDRHLDNLLLHQSGAFFHCDYSFLLGNDPKKYVPLRITEDMVHGMGGVESDNYAKFLSLASAAFLALRRPEIVRVLLSMIRLMETSSLPDITENQSIEEAIMGVRERLRLDLTDDDAVVYMEELIERSLKDKIWIAVDAIHNLGKKF